MFKRVLISTDLSDGLYRLVNFIPSLAANGIERIVFLHTVPLWEEGRIPREDTEKIDLAKSRLSPALDNVPDGVEVKIEVVTSNKPDETILETAKTHNCDVTILGANIHTLLDEKLFGSTSACISEHTETPLMVLRPQLISTYTCEELSLRCRHLFRYLMIPYDDSKSARYLVQQVEQYALNRNDHSLEKCLLIWVLEEVGLRELRGEELLEQARNTLETIKTQLSKLDLEVNFEVRWGQRLQEITDAALEHDISAIAISTTRKNKLLDWSIPSFSNEVLRCSWHPLIFFPPPRK